MAQFKGSKCANNFLLILLVVVLAGCATIQPSLLSKYMTQAEVKSQFGNPLYVRTAKLKDDRQIEEWEYMNKGFPKTRTVMFFNSDGKLIYWQEYCHWVDKPNFNLPQELYE